jgi:predicted N-formylglutamate amidohydrolase
LSCSATTPRTPSRRTYPTSAWPGPQFERHIGYDIGAAHLTRALARSFGAPAILTTFSRLVIDPNRGRDDPTLVMRLSDGAVVPGNARIGAAGIERRLRRFYDPYDAAITAAVERGSRAGAPPAIVSLHSFTPVWRGEPRPWHAGVLWGEDGRIARPLLAALKAEPALVVGDNEPYVGVLEGDTLDRHAARRGLPHVLLEVRQDQIATAADADGWAERLHRPLAPILAGLSREVRRVA